MVEQGVEGNLEVAGGIGCGGRRDADPQKRLGAERMKRGIRDHRAGGRIGRQVSPAEGRIGRIGRIVAVTGEHLRQARDVVRGVAGQGPAQVVRPGRAVLVQLHEPDGHQLHHLPGIVFVGIAACDRVLLLIAQPGQVDPHHRVQGHLFEKRPEIAKRVIAKHVVIGTSAQFPDVGVGERNHENLGQRQLHALPKLVLIRRRVLPETPVDIRGLKLKSRVYRALGGQSGRQVILVR